MSEEKTNSEAKEMKFDLEVAPIESITRAEVDCQIATARQYPRSLAQFYKRAEAMVTIDQETAESCFYQLKRKDKTSPTGYKIIEGESIRMAEIVAANFGNLRSAVHIVGHTPTRVSVRAVCHDLETNNFIAVEKQAKTTYSGGEPYNEDMAITTTNALVSKALRDAIFRVVPKALLKPLMAKAKLVAFGEGAAFTERRKKAVTWATVTRKVPLDRVLAALGVKGEEDITVDHLAVLTGLKNAIMEGEQSVDEAFPPLETGKPVFEHPAKVQQEAEQKQAAAVPAPEPEKRGPGRPKKIEGGVQGPPPEQMQAMQNPPAAVAQTEPAAAPVAQPPAETDQTLAMPGLELTLEEPPAGPKVMTELQKQLQEHVEGTFKHTLEEFTGWAGKAIPYYKDPAHPLPKDWTEIPDDKCRFFITNIKGVDAGIKNWKSKKQ